MLIEIGHVEAIFRYPVKSMGGERLEVAKLGWHGLDGDRRLAFRRIDDRSGFPWLSATKLPDLLLFAPHRPEDGAQGDLPTHIRTPDGEEMPAFGEDLATGEGDDAPAITVTMRDVRCSMVNLDPDSASRAPELLKAVVRANQNTAGVYGTVTRVGRLAVGQTILLRAATEKKGTWVTETQCPGTPPNPRCS